MNTKIIKLDINNKMYETITAKQGDTESRFLLFHLFDASLPFDLTEKSVRVYGIKPDGTKIFNDLVINDVKKGYCTLKLTNQMLAIAGLVKLELVIYSGNKKLSSIPFMLNVISSLNSDDAVVSTNEFTSLMNGLAALSEYDIYKSNAKQVPGIKEEVSNLSSQLDTNTNNIDYINENVKLNNIQNLQGLKRIDIFCGIDSLTAGAGGNSYINFLEPCLRSQLGDGGAGLCMLDYGKSVENNHSFGKSPNVKYMINDSWDSIPRKYSICGLGCYTINADGKQYINYDCKRKYTSAKVIFLKQPNGGTFKIGNMALNVSTYTLVNTLSSDYELGYLDLNINNWASSGITIKEITGNVAIFGLYFKNGDDGVTVSRLAIAGSKLSEHLKLDEKIYIKWFELLEPSAYIFNGGMNDRTEMDTNTYKSSILSLLSRIKNGCDTTQIILEYCNYSSDYQTTYLKGYEQVLKDIAFENFYGFISDKDVFGNYEKANNKGLMLDEIHPNTKGNKVKANNIAEYLGFNSNYILKEYEQFTSGTSIKEYINELSTVVKTVNFGETETIYKLGLINGYTTAIFEIEIYMQPNSDYSGLKKKIAICGKSATVLNEVTAIHSINESTEFEMKGSNVTMNMVVNCEVVNNKLEIKVTPTATKATTNLLCNLIVTGKVTSCYTGAAGKLVYEN
ncbi:SGNH/GDSL hydrolase family protein [Clostridium sp.]|uniref:SGNH/GDSL hydrolase family protein n=1 Tax=Clostridium sp. TaxID=1506 RepID=UPI0025BF5212|nr:SGNH/GDSL hydrolase family protein [Clostridium sp.]